MMNIVHLKKFEDLYPVARKNFEQQKEQIVNLIPKAEVQHVGGTAIPGALSIGDLDIQIRVKKNDFSDAIKKVSQLYNKNHPELWTEGFALFKSEGNIEMPISVVLTVIGSSYDEFYKVRDKIKSSPELLEKYNKLKGNYEGKSEKEYREAKKEFFGPNGESRLLEN